MEMEDGSTYEGQWSLETGLRHGKGVQRWPDGGCTKATGEMERLMDKEG